MSDISDIYDALITRIEAVLPSNTRLKNPYQVEDNDNVYLNLGFGVAFGPGENTNRQATCDFSVRRDFIVVLTRSVFATDTDPIARADVEKSLFEDQKLLIADVEGEPTLGSTAVVKSDYVGDSGLEFVFGGKEHFVKLETTISIEYFETL